MQRTPQVLQLLSLLIWTIYPLDSIYHINIANSKIQKGNNINLTLNVLIYHLFIFYLKAEEPSIHCLTPPMITTFGVVPSCSQEAETQFASCVVAGIQAVSLPECALPGTWRLETSEDLNASTLLSGCGSLK